ncbi:ZIP family metal transporter [Arthrobacter sp. M4]|uniref:ZIP family metal transporter n=1 Tax=Arthrobacter sp. M4 TaxID=218160 RepID=UPI001CDD6F61|nr:ZIP family metal transporter [Arthrobacter sp. M4]MCA4133199.1 ZIP family metal transporter [Arthrobacter sp. M4]
MTATQSRKQVAGWRRWVLGLGPLLLIAVVAVLFAALNPALKGLSGGIPPKEEVAVESIRLDPGQIVITARNVGPDPVSIAQVNVSDFYTTFEQSRPTMAPLESTTISVSYNWVEGDPYEIALVTSTGGKFTTDIAAAAASPERGTQFFGLMALLGVYVGVIPVALGMLWMPFVRRSPAIWVRALLGLTVGLLAFLAFDAAFEAFGLVAGNGAFGGPLVVVLGALLAYLLLEGSDALMVRRRDAGSSAAADLGGPARAGGLRLALLVAVGIGLHNLGEGLAIGSAYAVGSLALGTSLIVGFALHNTTEGLAIVTPLSRQPAGLWRLMGLGLIAGAPAILGAVLGATVFQPALAAFLLGLGAGAVAQVAIKILPLMKDPGGRVLTVPTVVGMVAGMAAMFTTGLLVVA